MRRAAALLPIGLVLLAIVSRQAMADTAFVLPPPATDSRARSFCTEWLRASEPSKHACLREAERSERGRYGPDCRAALRATLRRTLTAECRNWSKLMDFEVRHVVDRVLRSCTGQFGGLRERTRSSTVSVETRP